MAGKQKWIIDIKCINVTGEAIAPILIFKNEYMNIWIYDGLIKRFLTVGISQYLKMAGFQMI